MTAEALPARPSAFRSTQLGIAVMLAGILLFSLNDVMG